MKKQRKKQIISVFVCLNLIFSQSFLAADLPITPDNTKSPNLFIDQTANKVDIANIEAPINSVSHNVFKDFNINENGLIFNNSNSITSTKLGGVIYKNPNFSSHEANTIIAEISGTNKTHLFGFGEIAGKKADLIIVNPNGIIANGAGFINTNNISFDTRSQDNSAKFEVLGEGIDLTNTNKAEILANLVELNAAIYGGNELQIKLENSSNLASNLEPQYALDAKAFGSMYAGKIKIIANNAGIGVRSNADIIAQDELIINSNGDLELANTKANIINLQSNSNIKLNDKVIADELNLNADKFTHDTAEFLVKNALNLNANELNINKEIITSANLNLNAPKISQNTFIFTLRDVGVNGDEIENIGDIWANNIFITANSQFINLAGMLHSNEDIFINAPIIQNQGVVSGDYSGVWASRKANEFYAKELAELERLKRTVCDDCTLNSFGFKLLKCQLDAKIEAKKNEFVAQAININAFSQDYKDSINRRFDLMNDGWKGNFWAYDAQILQSDFTTNKATINARNNLNLIGNSIINQEADIFVGNDLNVQANKFANQREALIIKQGVTFAKVREYTDRTWYGKKKKRKTNEYINTTYDNVLYSDKPTNIFVGNDANIVAQNSFLNGDNANPAAFTIGENKTNEISIDLDKNPYLSKNPDKNSPYAYVINPKIIDLFAKNPEFGYTEVSNPFLSDPSLYAGSEYFLNKLGFEPKSTDKFLASAELSSALLKQSLQANSAKKYLQNFDESIKELVDNAQSEYKRLNLTPFVSLSPEQVKALKSDIIWYEYEYKNGSVYAVPKIYLSNETLSNIASTAISTKGNLNIKADEIVSNDTINSDRSISLVGKNIHLNSDYRQASLNSAGDLNIIANDKFINKGTNLSSNENINLHAKNLSISANVLKNINLATNQFSQTMGEAKINANNINLISDDISINGANLTAKENINSNSKNLSIFGVQSFKKTQTGNYDNYTITQQIRNEAANLSAQNINLIADNEILITGSNLNAQDELNLQTNGDLIIQAGANLDYYEKYYLKEGVFKSKEEISINQNLTYDNANLNARNINLQANNVNLTSTNLNSHTSTINANQISIGTAQNQSQNYHKVKKSKFNFAGILGFGSIYEADLDEILVNSIKNQSSNLHSTSDLNLNANNNINIIGSNLSSNSNLNLNSFGGEINILNSQDITEITTKNESKKIGFTNINDFAKQYIDDIKNTSIQPNATLANIQKSQDQTQRLIITANTSNLQANNININSHKNTNIQASNLNANENINITSQTGDINIISSQNIDQTSSNSKLKETLHFTDNKSDSTNLKETNVKSNLSAQNINLNANTITLQASNIIANQTIEINADELNLISAKDNHTNISNENNKGSLIAEVKSQGKITEIEIPAIIEVGDKFILNGKDISDKLDKQIYETISNSLNDETIKNSIIKSISSNSKTPLDETTINQIKATLNNDEWDKSTKSLSQVGAIVVTIVVTYFTAGAGTAAAASLTAAGATATTAAATSAATTAVISNLAVQSANIALSKGEIKFDINSLVSSVATATLGSMVSSATNSLNTNSFTKDTINSVANAGIKSGIYGTDFKDSLIANLTNQITDTLYQSSGDIALNTGLSDGDISKIALHATAGGISAELMGDKFINGAIISGTTQALSPITANSSDNAQLATSQLIGTIVGGWLNGDDGANLGYTLSTSAETNNRQLHKDEEKWLDENVDRFIEQQAKEGKFYSQQEARALLYTSAKYAVDGMENALINLFGSDFSKDEIINAQDFILSNTYGLKFRESGAEFGKEFDAFRPDDHDFYSDYNPNAIGALEDNSLFFVPVGRIAQGASGAIIRTTSGVFGRFIEKVGTKNLQWTSWAGYEKIVINNKEYAKIGNRLYTHHAVDRMQPSSLGSPAGTIGSGRNISPNIVESAIKDGVKSEKLVDGINRNIYQLGDVRVITENNDNIIISIIRASQ